jgi:hypothetical protein
LEGRKEEEGIRRAVVDVDRIEGVGASHDPCLFAVVFSGLKPGGIRERDGNGDVPGRDEGKLFVEAECG